MYMICLPVPIVQVPFMFKYAVDILTADPTGATAATTPLLAVMPATLLIGYGAARAGSALFNELRNAVFAKVCHIMSCYAVGLHWLDSGLRGGVAHALL